ncbi:hypothetical protein HRR83_002573 [Exophiala dermatitidis]|nr:hypothetical protein HRR73_005514 [Exophiala dermatitidis]KAJ4523747.1 hypothetical protein HRR74_001940 [Exophiala dermatitidis]KAJ4578684.1 hypothetical protein HRR81_002832 [Exophiala dermatitidis]KAJ4601375.1 hypothetical protein HRR83_002573 [Exophiala dermatitidis]KAJ4604792.1 hypothetical protein HRR84_001875 [Exophiala dermatitidis]
MALMLLPSQKSRMPAILSDFVGSLSRTNVCTAPQLLPVPCRLAACARCYQVGQSISTRNAQQRRHEGCTVASTRWESDFSDENHLPTAPPDVRLSHGWTTPVQLV